MVHNLEILLLFLVPLKHLKLFSIASGEPILIFRGTSSACPQVAALAALIASKKPSLTNIEVRQVIETSADKVGDIPFTNVIGFENGTRNEEMGYGRINVLNALNSIN